MNDDFLGATVLALLVTMGIGAASALVHAGRDPAAAAEAPVVAAASAPDIVLLPPVMVTGRRPTAAVAARDVAPEPPELSPRAEKSG